MFLTLSDWFDKLRQTRFGRKFLDILYETSVLVTYIGAIALIHVAEEKWVGNDALFFGGIVEVLREIVDIAIKSIVEALRDLMSLSKK